MSEDQVLLAWAKAKGAVALTTSSKKERLEGYLHAGDLVLTEQEIKAIDDAGAKGRAKVLTAKTVVRRAAGALILGEIGLRECSYFGLNSF
ncbi:hypothetical protein GALMADRAFT_223496 [Galerina marginata CBS 339.88]|uniref:Uncharacterized protein n=1 Tax=Galerina marginata (strain CBS 339.88) TaxID=685588 RepID=A0A067T7Z4_GALM3|nr:hypothetical protein GALMADRAFT_223496 [Galerina marginata CBS 339.88]